MPTITRVDLDNLDLLGILRLGADVWNEWREQNPHVEIDLRGVDLQRANLEKANLEKANLEKANLERANLRKTKLCRARLSGASIFRANLNEANLSRASIFRADLMGANLVGANLSGAYLFSTDLKRVDLAGASMIGAYLGGADLMGADLKGANLKRADLKGANLEEANLEGANLSETYCYEANLKGANLKGANLKGAIFFKARLERANLESTELTEFNTKGANLQEAIVDELDKAISINILDRDIDPEKEKELESAIDLYMAILGYKNKEVLSEERGSLFKRIRYAIDAFWSSDVKDRIQEEGLQAYKQSKAYLISKAEKPASESTQEMAAAVSGLVKAVENFDNAAMRIEKLVVVKLTDKEGSSKIFVETISTELKNQLDANPKILHNPQAVADFLQTEQKATPIISSNSEKEASLVGNPVFLESS